MSFDRQKYLDACNALSLTVPTRDRLLGWLDGLSDEARPEALALVDQALAASTRTRVGALALLANSLSASRLDGRARALLLRRAIERRDTMDDAAARAEALQSAPSAEAYDALLAELARDVSGPSLGNAHTLFLYAWRAAPPEAQTATLIHRGEPEPMIGARGAVRVALYTARALAHLATADERAIFDDLLAATERALVAREHVRSPVEAVAEKKKGILTIALAPVREMTLSLHRPDSCGAAARPAMTKAVKLLGERDGAAAVRAFLAGLDEELRRADVLYAIEQREKAPTSPVVRAIWRGVGDKGLVALWCAELADGRFGLLRKEGRRWVWSEGAPDEILAQVPDAHFDAASRAAHERSR